MCNQGWLVIVKTNGLQSLRIVCGECFTEYDTPQEMICGKHPQRPFSTDIRFSPPSLEDIISSGWASFVVDMEKWKTGELEPPIY
jgi:hypothetical protein